VFSPVEEISLLHTGTPEVLSGVQITSGSFVPLNPGNQLQVVASFSLSNSANQKFGFRVLSSKDGSQYTDVGVTYGNLHGPVNNTDLPGDEYRQFYYDDSTPTEDERVALCQQTCQNEATSMNCVSWTYVRQGYALGEPLYPSPRCSLKNGIPGPNPSQCCVSGTLTTNPVVISYVDRSKSGSGNLGLMQNSVAMASASVLDLQLLLDHSIIELFVGGGRSVLTGRSYPTNTDNYISVFNTGDTALTVNLTRYQLTSSDPTSS
jgi:sucrose-6-phosphate hydrolase SacC (GH32 family)